VKPAIYVGDDGCEGDGERNLGGETNLDGFTLKDVRDYLGYG